MIKVTVGNNVNRSAVIIDENTTLRACLEANNIDFARGSMNLDGSSLGAGDLNKTFKDLGYDGTPGHDKCYLLNMVKTDNAVRVIW